jgi:hypothetical protein
MNDQANKAFTRILHDNYEHNDEAFNDDVAVVRLALMEYQLHLSSERLIRDEWDVVLDEHGSADTYLNKEEAVAAAARLSTPHDKLEVVHIRLYEVTNDSI